MSLVSPFNEHVQDYQFSPDCDKCGSFVRVIENEAEFKNLKEETYRVVEDCKLAFENNLVRLRELQEADNFEEDEKILEAVENIKKLYEILKAKYFVDFQSTSAELTETICILQSCITCFEENNQYD